ncbi:MAG TPA: lysozyme inhibitor LprI family protein [Flavobacterium sp.]|nr:lysozyme inhibitor LprI family protein [Flavobacterium sp.]
MRKLLLILITNLFILPIFSQEKEYPIDVEMNHCLQNVQSTADQRNCISNAYTKWDKLLNEEYRKLLKKFTDEEKDLFIVSQRNWIMFRDKEFEFINTYYYNNEKGTLFFVMGDLKKMEIVKKRVLEFQEYSETFEN